MTDRLPRGDLKLLEHPAAQQLLASTELARIAYKNVAEVDQTALKMVRIVVGPSWVGVIDFVTKFNGGATAEEFASRGQDS